MAGWLQRAELQVTFADRRNACIQTIRLTITRYNRSGGYHTPRTNAHSWKDCAGHADPSATPNSDRGCLPSSGAVRGLTNVMGCCGEDSARSHPNIVLKGYVFVILEVGLGPDVASLTDGEIAATNETNLGAHHRALSNPNAASTIDADANRGTEHEPSPEMDSDEFR
jgi:hypothetical protein